MSCPIWYGGVPVPHTTFQRSEHLFTVRIWQEDGQEEAGTWRGLVVHVRSDHRLYFTTLADLNDFITLHIHHGRTTRPG